MKLLFILLLGMSIFSSVMPPNDLEIQGKITDASTGNPVASATVQTKNGQHATITASDGTFRITVPDNTKKLLVSAVGYEQQEITLTKNQAYLDVKLQLASARAEEVIVSGYSKAQPLSEVVTGRAAGVITSRHHRKQSRHTPVNEPEFNTEDYDAITENRFREAANTPLSTFSIDVDGASYSNVRRYLHSGQLPPAGAVRIEELINYFRYNYRQPNGEHPFSVHTEVSACPWNPQHHLVLIGLQGRRIDMHKLPASNLVFLIDVSGSMMDENKLPLVKASLQLLTEQLREEDKVSMVVYAGNAGLVLPATSGDQKQRISDAIEGLEAGGSTAGGAGIRLAYDVARKNFLNNGNNRVILCTDGDFNVGVSSDAELERIIEEERKSGVFLTVLGYGMGNYKDNKMQKLADKGNGNHSYIDNIQEAKKVLVSEFGGTLFTIAKDVKLQVEFNPSVVQAYRLVGYENRLLNKEDFNNDKKDAGEIGSGHTVTALYEVIPVGVTSSFIEKTDPLRYQENEKTNSHAGFEMMNVKIRYKKPDENKSMLLQHPVAARVSSNLSEDFRFISAVAQYGMLLNNSEFRQQSSFMNARRLASAAIGTDAEGYRKEFIELIGKAEALMSSAKNR